MAEWPSDRSETRPIRRFAKPFERGQTRSEVVFSQLMRDRAPSSSRDSRLSDFARQILSRDRSGVGSTVGRRTNGTPVRIDSSYFCAVYYSGGGSCLPTDLVCGPTTRPNRTRMSSNDVRPSFADLFFALHL